jgi:hypothetical protein
MNFIRKFYDAAVAEAGGEVASEAPAQMSMAEAMAKHGKKTDENSPPKEAVVIPEKKEEEVKKEEPVVAATATPESSEEKPASEAPKTDVKVEESVKVETPPIAAEPPKVPALDEVLKKNQPEAIFKALGFDDDKVALIQDLKEIDPKLVGIIQAWKNGTLGEYVNELGTDYLKMSAEDLMRHQLRREYPKASPQAFEALYESEVIERFKLDPAVYTEAEVEKGKLLLEAKADKYRDEFVANQEKYLMPKPPAPKPAPVPDNSAELAAKENLDSYVKEISNDPYTKDIFANKKITLGEGDSKFVFPVDPQALVNNLSDPATWVANMFDKVKGADGNEYSVPKTQHQMLVATVAQYGDKFFDAYAKHFKSLGAKEVTEPIDNASKPDNSTPAKAEVNPISFAEAMAKKGRRVG